MSQKQIKSALISVFYKDGLEPIVKELGRLGVTIYSTGGTQKFIEDLGVRCVPVEEVTTYPSILGGRVKTLHPSVFGGILGRRELAQDLEEMKQYKIPEIDLVIVDLYPFEETVKNTSEEQQIIEKIDIGGPSMIRAAAKNHKDLTVIAAKEDYAALEALLKEQNGATTLEQRRAFAAKAFYVVMNYDIAINNYFNGAIVPPFHGRQVLRYGENPHQQGVFYGRLDELFDQLNGKELSYNNLVDVDAAAQLMAEFEGGTDPVFAIIKHTNVCGVAQRSSLAEAWDAALAGDPESAFGGVLATNKEIDAAAAQKINELFFEILLAPGFTAEALDILKTKKNRILLLQKAPLNTRTIFKNVLGGTLTQDADQGNYNEWKEEGAQAATAAQKSDLIFANIICKHLKSNAIALVKDRQLLGKGCGQTSRVDALRHALEKAASFGFDLKGSVMASDAFFPFDDCVKMAHEAGIDAVIQPGGSIRDKDTVAFCQANGMALVITGMRHFRH
ncbi:bifunctional phosphoribosylaminoimidazolecarboxamide formyltransferase/IMP cyclohydrolase [Taibaiella koreensis]|uniref:bifunctional phosphoribosylaminoimidazolecarboxamide formyltransferase/IMP cyclohydrolase n=1 Tax=Taibaiella koreensis TaxID=1268548 RepID=UPI000E5A0386|nr:bifunctional phosphoribosylaminoimidazolecarboxamide formyltransferase/IMP cyclohydrolase [Taibaiella koreensis]